MFLVVLLSQRRCKLLQITLRLTITGKLATGSKDNTVIIWDFDPESLAVKLNKTLEPRSQGVSFFAWSPDSTRLAVCGPEDCDEIHLWNVDTGLLEGKISHSTEDSLTTVSWSPDGRKITCGGSRGKLSWGISFLN